MRKHLNNKGYMLVEIILASVLAMGVAFFITELSIKLKNKNDDLLVKTLVYTDQAIIYNTLMKDIYNNQTEFSCDNIKINGQTFEYNGFKNIISDYANIEYTDCSYDRISGELNIHISLNVPQLPKPNEDFDVIINTQKIINPT